MVCHWHFLAVFIQIIDKLQKLVTFFLASKFIATSLPQECHLGPLLFLLCVNYLPNVSSLFSPILFADDTTVIFKGDNVCDVCN